MKKAVDRVAVLGAGLQGTCIALELSARGIGVDLYDAAERPLSGASRVNEGKIHLGLVYAGDPSLKTGDTMIAGAVRFRSLLERFVPADAFRTSEPFDYIVSRKGLASSQQIETHFQTISDRFAAALRTNDTFDYLGTRPDWLFRGLDLHDYAQRFAPLDLSGAFRTQEVSVDPNVLAEALSARLAADPNVSFKPAHEVRAVSLEAGQISVRGQTGNREWQQSYPQAVNALWAGRLSVDQSAGLPMPKSCNYRLKLRILCEPVGQEVLERSVTALLGPFGDAVRNADGTIYLSWYPACLKGWSTDLTPPRDWQRLCGIAPIGQDNQEMAHDIVKQAARDWCPAFAQLKPIELAGGIIVGTGGSDISDPESLLHRRDMIGVYSEGGYHSVSTGKYTTAPHFAHQTAERVFALM